MEGRKKIEDAKETVNGGGLSMSPAQPSLFSLNGKVKLDYVVERAR